MGWLESTAICTSYDSTSVVSLESNDNLGQAVFASAAPNLETCTLIIGLKSCAISSWVNTKVNALQIGSIKVTQKVS